METINIETKKQSWMRFLNDFYSGMPRIKSQLEISKLIDKGDECEIRIPILKEQEKWLDHGLTEYLVKTLNKLLSTLTRFQDDFPGLDNISFSLKLSDGKVLPTYDMGVGKNISNEQEDAEAEKFCNTLEIDEDLPDDIYSKTAISFAKILSTDDFEALYALLNDNTRMISYRKRTIVGKKEFVEYWKWLSNLLRTEHIVTDYRVKYNAFIEHAVVSFRQRDYYHNSTDEVYIFLYLEDNRISCAVATPQQQQPITVRYYDLDRPALNFEEIMREKEDVLTPEPNRMPCLHCGRLSENLEWYKLYLNSGPFGHIGQVSVCPRCKKQVEFYPEIFLRQA